MKIFGGASWNAGGAKEHYYWRELGSAKGTNFEPVRAAVC
jgi:hypothetical protein